MTSEDIKHQFIIIIILPFHSSGAVWESRWTSWAVRPNEPSGFRGRKDLLNRASALVTTCPWYVNWHLRTLSISSSSSYCHADRSPGAVKVEVSLLGSPSLTAFNMVSQCGRKATFEEEVIIVRAQKLCESQGGRPGLPVLIVSMGVKQLWTWTFVTQNSGGCVKIEVAVLGSSFLWV